VCEARIKEIASRGSDAQAVYKLKSTNSSNLCRQKHMYSEEQMTHMRDGLQEFLHFFGYTNHPDEPENNTAFFNFENQTPA
jgi:hypothetical protein